MTGSFCTHNLTLFHNPVDCTADSKAGEVAELLPLLGVTFRDVSYRGFWFFPWLESKSPQEKKSVVQKTLQLMAEGIMDPPIGEKRRGSSNNSQPQHIALCEPQSS